MMDVERDPVTELPAAVRQKIAHLGEQGTQWPRDLPGLVAELERRWSITVGTPLPGGTAAYVARAQTVDGQDAVLKVAIPARDSAGQMRVIAAAHGRGYVHLLAHDTERNAMLQEALGPSMADLALAPGQAIVALCATLSRAWTVPPDPAVTPARDKAEQLGRLVHRLWNKHGHPCPEQVANRALQFAGRRTAAFDPGRCVVVHGDPHPANALQVLTPRAGAESGFAFVDPNGFLADPAYDLGVVLRDWCPQLLAAEDPSARARKYCGLLATASGLEETAIWEWGYLERVSTGLYCLDLGAGDLARSFLTTADRIAAS